VMRRAGLKSRRDTSGEDTGAVAAGVTLGQQQYGFLGWEDSQSQCPSRPGEGTNSVQEHSSSSSTSTESKECSYDGNVTWSVRQKCQWTIHVNSDGKLAGCSRPSNGRVFELQQLVVENLVYLCNQANTSINGY